MAELKADKSLGQHFLSDAGVIAHIVDAIYPQKGERIIEIGPGLGALTLPVLAECGELTAIEFDARMLAPLQQKARSVGKLNLVQANVLEVRFSEALAPPLRLIGNLPYNLSSPILFHCLAQRDSIQDMHFMLQKEVVERIAAAPGSKTYGRLSLMSQLYCEPEILFEIPPACFDPPPKVDSAVIRLIPRRELAWPMQSVECFDKVVRAAFSQRRKMLRKSLNAWFSAAELMAVDIDPTLRPEALDGAGFARLADLLYQKSA